MRQPHNKKFLGVVVNPYMVQSEGLLPVFDNLDRVGATSIGLTVQVGRPVGEGEGKRIPDLHLDGYRRTLTRPAWGRKEFFLDSYSVLSVNDRWYADSSYRPAHRPVPSGIDTTVPQAMVDEAHRRGMRVYLQIWPTIPPGLRETDQPELPDGSHARLPHVALTGSPASEPIREYGRSLLRHVLDEFGSVDGIIVDWNEFGAYDFSDLFGGCEEALRPFAERLGIDFDEMRTKVRAIWQSLHTLTTKDLSPAGGAFRRIIDQSLGWQDFQRVKAEAVCSSFAELREVQSELGHDGQELVARGWPPPWNRMSGLWYERLAGVCTHVAPKLFAFDYCAVPRWYGQTLTGWNPSLDEERLLEELVHWLGIPDRLEHRSFDDYFIPAEEDPQPAGVPVYREKIAQVAGQPGMLSREAPSAGSELPIRPLAHAHMPDPMWREMVEMLMSHENIDGFWVQMYAYLSDSKLEILRRARRETSVRDG